MRIIYLSITVLTLIISLLSCEKVKEDTVINAQDYYGDGSFFISLARLSSPNVNGNFCSNPKVFELRTSYNLKAFGTVTIYSDGRFLNFQYDLLPNIISEGWVIVASLVWVGVTDDWEYGRDGPVGGWSAVPDINLLRYDASKPTNALHQIPLEDWMFDDCFVVAVRLALDDPNINREAPKAFINHGDYISYTWNEPFCLEGCDDPGTYTTTYWEDNPDAWPYGLTIGGQFYSEQLAIQLMKADDGTSGDMTYTMFDQIIAAKLNVAIGNTSYCVAETIEAADLWLENYGPVGSGVFSTSPAWSEGAPLANMLNNYNNGTLCAESGE